MPSFQTSADGWIHIAPHGTFPHPTGALQVIDAEACDAILRTFEEESRQPNFPGLLVDFDHASHDPAQPTTAAGWLNALEHRPDGLYARVRWSDLGTQALDGGRYRLASPVWNRADCDAWTAPAGLEGRDMLHLRPRRLDRLALTNDPNLPGLTPLTNRKEKGEREKLKGADSAASLPVLPVKNSPASPNPPPVNPVNSVKISSMNLRNDLLQHLQLDPALSDDAIVNALRRQHDELDTLRDRCHHLEQAQAESDLDRFAEVITNRDVVRAQLLANRDGALALLNALRRPEPSAPLHQPGAHRPNLHLLSPIAEEANPSAARRIANRARQLQSQLKIGHHAAFRLAEAEEE